MKNLKKSQNIGDIFWRKHMDESVVDLRKLVKNGKKGLEKKTHTKTHKTKKIAQPVKNNFVGTAHEQDTDTVAQDAVSNWTNTKRDAEIPEFFAALKKYRTEKASFLSKDKLSKELSELDIQDTELQAKLPKSNNASAYQVIQASLIPPKQEQAYKIQLTNEQIFQSLSRRQQKGLRKKILKDNLFSLDAHQLQDIEQPTVISETQGLKPEKKKGRQMFVRAISFAILLLLVAGIPILTLRAFSFRDKAQLHAQTAFNFMLDGKDALLNLDAQGAEENFKKAQEEFNKIEEGLEFLSLDFVNLFASFPIQSQLSSTAHLFRMGKLFSSSGFQISQALALLQGLPEFNGSNMEQQNTFTDNVIKASFALEQARLNIKYANTEFSFIRPQDIPEKFQSSISAIQQQSLQIEKLFEQTFSSLDVLLAFLGHQSEKNYLLIFQNSSELRATGGFIGTYGLIQINKGNVKDLFIEGIYNPDGQLSINVVPPRPLQYITPDWGTRDSNWFFDFPTSAEKAAWFYEQTGGINTDGVIAITPRVVEKLLMITGAIDMPEYNLKLTADNFLELVQQEVEVDYDKSLNRPKQILADFAPRLIEKLKLSDNNIAILNVLFESLNNKDIQIYSKDSIVQDFIADREWSGEVKNTDKYEDYLAVVISNLGGWKTDKYTQTEVDTSTTITGEGEILRSVIISRKHDGGHTPYIWYNKPNYGYIRVYAPLGSELISAEGFSSEPNYINTDYKKEGYINDFLVSTQELNTRKDVASGTDIFEESGKTVFGNWLHIPAGQRKLVKLTYKLPFRVIQNTENYTITIQKQSGIDIKYSGIIEEFHHNLSILNCMLDERQYVTGSFEFISSKDSKIVCDLIQ